MRNLHQHCGCDDDLSHLRPGQHSTEEMPEDDHRSYRIRRDPPPKSVKSRKVVTSAAKR